MNKSQDIFKLSVFTIGEKDRSNVLGTDNKKLWQHLFIKLRTHRVNKIFILEPDEAASRTSHKLSIDHIKPDKLQYSNT